MKRLLQAVVVLSVWATSVEGHAQNPDPRDYEAPYFLPSGSTLINTYLRHQSAVKGRDYTATAAAFRATYILKFGDLVVTPFDFILPVIDQTAYTSLATTLGNAAIPQDLKLSLHASGLGDVTFLPTIGSGFEQNAKDYTHTWFALTAYITAPSGKYSPSRVLNVGQNRWVINPLIMVGQRFLRVFTLEAMGNVAIYTDNDEFRVPVTALRGRDLTLKQKASYGAAVHAAVDFSTTFFASTSYLLAVNGKRTFELPAALGGMEQTETKGVTVHSIRLNFGIRATPRTLLMFQWNEDVAASKEAVRSRFFGLRISHAFAGRNAKPPPAASASAAL